MAKIDRDRELTSRNPHGDRSTLYTILALAGLVVFGVVVWAASDYNTSHPNAPQTETQAPATI